MNIYEFKKTGCEWSLKPVPIGTQCELCNTQVELEELPFRDSETLVIGFPLKWQGAMSGFEIPINLPLSVHP